MYKWLCEIRQLLQAADQRLRLFLEGRTLEALAWECLRCGSRWTREEWAKRCPVCHSPDWALPTAQVLGEEEQLSPIPQPIPSALVGRPFRPPRGRPKGAKDSKPRKRRKSLQERAAELPIDTYDSQPEVEYFARHADKPVERPVEDIVPEEVIGGVSLEGEVPSPQARVRVGEGQRDLSAELGLTRSPDVATVPRMPTPPPGLGGPPPPPGLRKSLSEQLAERSKEPL